MKALQPETQLEAVVDALFRRWPSLVGFSVQDAETLVLADIETDPWPARPQLFNEIAVALLELMDYEPAARELLRGRTFARTLH